MSIAVPSYNSEQYLHYCVEALSIGGDQVEILIINDGSRDHTQEVAEQLAQKHSNVRAIYQENKGHGGAVNTGLREAKGLYFKVVDSDDWVDSRAYLKVLETLQMLEEAATPVDAFITNFVYEKEGSNRKRSMSYPKVLPEERIFTWEDIGNFKTGQYMMMHSLIYRTELLRKIQFSLPEHTFYVDNIFVFTPLQAVEKMYYLPVDFYRYLIGREDQSVNEEIMISRIDQQLAVNKILIKEMRIDQIREEKLLQYLLNHVEITSVISSALLNKAGSRAHMEKKRELWAYMKSENPALYRLLRKTKLSRMVNQPGYPGRKLSNGIYRLARRLYGFN
ncbi:Glycosyltransferase [Streptococcus sp. DD13]|nr:Glycosyltransferase [Streptococcus sp. DD13]